METKEQSDNITIEEPQQDKTEQPIVDLNVKHPGGRPTKYNDEILQKAREYLQKPFGKIYKQIEKPTVKTHPETREKYVVNEPYIYETVEIPTREGLALHIGVHNDTTYDWDSQESKTEFSDIIRELEKMQAVYLITGGISGDYNPTISKVLLTKHGYREGKELTGEGGSQLLPSKVTIEMPE